MVEVRHAEAREDHRRVVVHPEEDRPKDVAAGEIHQQGVVHRATSLDADDGAEGQRVEADTKRAQHGVRHEAHAVHLLHQVDFTVRQFVRRVRHVSASGLTHDGIVFRQRHVDPQRRRLVLVTDHVAHREMFKSDDSQKSLLTLFFWISVRISSGFVFLDFDAEMVHSLKTGVHVHNLGVKPQWLELRQ